MRSFHDRMVALVCALGLVLAAAAMAHAGPYEDALVGFTEGSLSDTGDAIDKVVASGNPMAAQVLGALQDARLMFSAAQKKVYIKTKDDKLLDAATGKPVAGTPPDDIDTVIVNNRLRGVIDAALGSLTLMSPNLSQRYDAAQAVFKSRDASALSALDKAMAAEKNPRVRKAMSEAHAAIVLTDDKSSRCRQDRRHSRHPRPRRSGCARACSTACRRTNRRKCMRRSQPPGTKSRAPWRSGIRCRTPGTGSRSARCCCSPPSASPSPSASWASSTWRTARW